MKILAIRGCNLASLAGEFEIDLARGPLGGSGVFAIVGNTGAGKSTLLDALCVALFDKTPRLNNHSTVKVGRGSDEKSLLGAQDVRTLLRRGASQGWAEVDFESSDAQQYRARWSVRRARGQVDGNLQDQQLSLTAIVGGERFGGTKTETLKAIQTRLGLSFDQFRRSALLAQGEFAAFLRADGKDRSELLERMTGTQIYTRLSIAAHLRATLAEQRLRDGRAAALAISVLDDAQVAGVRDELAAARAAADEARRRHQVAAELARWLAEAARRQAQLDQAAADHAGSRAAVTAAEADRAELALRQRAERLRPAWDDAARLARGVATAVDDVTAAGQAAAQASERLEAIAGRRARVTTLHAPVRAARIAAGLVERTAGAVASELVGAAASETVAPGTASDAAWLMERRALVAEVAAWPELDARFAQHAALTDGIAALDRAIHEQAETRTRLAQAHKRIVSENRAATAKHEEAKRKAASFAQKRGMTLDAAGRLENEARVHLAEIERLVALAAQARDAVTARGELEGALAALATAGQAELARRGVLGEAQRIAQAVRGEQAIVVEGLRRAAGYEHARAELVDGEPCPLCGAEAHPWRDRGALDDVIAAAEARLAASVAALDGLAAEAAELGARDDHRRREQARLTAALAAQAASSAGLATAWRERLGALGELLLVGDPADPAAGALATERLTAAKKRLDDARTTRSQAEAATKAAQDAQGEVQLCQSALDQLAAKLVEHDKRVAEIDASLGRARGERASKAEHHATLDAELAAAMRRWRDALPGEADDDAAERALTQAEIVALVRRLTASAPVRQAPGMAAPTGTLAIVRVAMATVVAAWRERAERIALADAALAAAEVAIEREARDVDRAVAEHTARRGAAEQRRDQLAREHATAVAQLATARVEAGFEPDELRRLLAADPSRVDALAERLAALNLAVEKTRSVRTERERQVAAHATARPISDLPPGDAADVDALAAAVTAADQRVAQLGATLTADAEARARRAAALADVEAEAQGAEVDRILGDVIGSHDGKLFRSFAQSLTLDSLLAVANDHLEELAPRYQLERVPRHDLELQVIDRDLGSEVRSVQSLSGGESFLVSLALALGLSSMSAHDVRVRTLLIDEGFGTLDPATLDSALAVLDALQATGRQVGVISHVPALVERVGAHVRVVQRGGGRSEVVVA